MESKKIALFVTCLVDLLRPRIGFSAVRLLETVGFEVVVPRQSCCGQPNYNSGDRQGARSIAKRTIQTLEPFDTIVVLSGSCAGMITVHYPQLFESDPEWSGRAVALKDKTHELASFLHGVADLALPASKWTRRATYHDACAGLRELGIRKQPRALLSRIAGLELEELRDSDVCCGFGGAFCVKYPEISVRMSERKIENIVATGAQTVIAGDLGCLLTLEGSLRRGGHPVEALHFAEVLAGMVEDGDADH